MRLKRRLKRRGNVSHCLSDCGKLFPSRGATLAKARSPNNLKRVDGTFRRPAKFNGRERVSEYSTRRSDIYCGASPWSALNVIRRILNVILFLDW